MIVPCPYIWGGGALDWPAAQLHPQSCQGTDEVAEDTNHAAPTAAVAVHVDTDASKQGVAEDKRESRSSPPKQHRHGTLCLCFGIIRSL